MPSNIKIVPPANSAFDLNRVPNILPTLTPAVDMAKVVKPIIKIAVKIFSAKKEKVIPTASASMLVAIANNSILMN